MRKISFVFSIIFVLPLLGTPAKSAIECKAELPADRTGHWKWREVDGQRCWYPGRHRLEKANLHWPQSAPPPAMTDDRSNDASAEDAAGLKRPRFAPAPATTDGRSNETFQELHSHKTEELSFEDRWPR